MRKPAMLLCALCLCMAGVIAAPPADGELARSIVIMEPDDGTPIRPGEKFEIVIRMADHPDIEYVEAADLLGGTSRPGRATETSDDGLWHVPVRIPRDAIGEREFRVVAGLRDGDGVTRVEGGTVELAIDLEGIHVKLFAMKPAKIFCDPEQQSEAQLIVRARFSDGEARDMTRGKLGTRYRSTNREVAEVDADGKVTCLAPGRALVFAELDENSAQATIVVEEPEP